MPQGQDGWNHQLTFMFMNPHSQRQ